MRARRWIVPIIAGAAFAGCSRQQEDGQQSSEGELTPQVREMIRAVMIRSVNPTYTELWKQANRGNLAPVPDLARELNMTSASIRMALSQGGDVPEEVVSLYARMATQADSIGANARAGDLPAVLELTGKMRRETCDGCHVRYRHEM